VRTERYKLIYYNRIDQWELFDLKNDPHELKNTYADPANGKIVAGLRSEMARLRRELNDHDQLADQQ
jgi:arylsulfatase A-like enzyme